MKRGKRQNLRHRKKARGNRTQMITGSQWLTQIWLIQPYLVIKVLIYMLFFDIEMYLLYNIILSGRRMLKQHV